MARLFVFLVAIVAVLALAEGGKGDEKGAKGDKKGGRAAKKCAKNIKTFESCLKKGYQSKAGCISEDGELSKKDMKKCGRFEKQLKKCDYSCDKKEVEHLFGGSTKPMESTSTWETTDGNRSADD